MLGWMSYAIPRKFIAENVRKSAELLLLNERAGVGNNLYHQDYFTDGLMLDMVISGSEDLRDSWHDFIDSPYCVWGEPSFAGNAIKTLEIGNACRDEEGYVEHYTRYWHGYLVPLRLAMCVMDLGMLRIVNYIFLWGLFIFCIWLLWKRLSGRAAFWLGIVVGLVGLPAVAGCLQYSTCFYIMLLSTASILSWPRITRSMVALCVTMFVTGGFTSYLDFLVTPIITLGIPLAVALMRWDEESRSRGAIWGIVCWFAGYAGIWVSKWVLGILILGPDVFSQTMDSIALRTYDLSGLQSIMLKVGMVAVMFASVCSALFVYSCRHNQGERVRSANKYLIIIGWVPFIWYLVLLNHSLVHWVFTWRTIIVTLFCWGLYFINVVRPYPHEPEQKIINNQ